ncbi:GxxExxY protein [Pseudoxanthomonas sp. UTMC 1351]|uniref:GxxExxY protein n=1 Tax=Pseudoxanthomonas sp. UTMC 1351 TaxID=2695853 RepID=UPI0034CF9CD8
MYTDKKLLIEEGLTERVIGVFYDVYNELGAGFLESVYENAFAIALREVGIDVQQQVSLQVEFRGLSVGAFKVDLLISKCLIVELKAVAQLNPAHEVQLVNYLKASGVQVELLFNFGPRPQFKRRIFGHASNPCPSALIRVQKDV